MSRTIEFFPEKSEHDAIDRIHAEGFKIVGLVISSAQEFGIVWNESLSEELRYVILQTAIKSEVT